MPESLKSFGRFGRRLLASFASLPYEVFLLGAVIVWTVSMSIIAQGFAAPDNLLTVARRMSEEGIVATGMTLVIISGGIDLSVGSLMGVTVAVGGVLFALGLPLWLAFGTGMALAVGFGFINGILVIKARLQPIIVTLATMIALRSLDYGITSGKAVGGFADKFAFLGQGSIGPVPVPLIFFAICAIAGSFLLHRTTLGRHIYAVGGNEKAAYTVGVRVARIKLFVYVFSAAMAVVAALIYTARVGAANPAVGESMALDVITAVLIGGTSITGGKGRIVGTILGVFLLSSMINGLHLLGMGTYWQMVFVGAVLLLVIIVESRRGGWQWQATGRRVKTIKV